MLKVRSLPGLLTSAVTTDTLGPLDGSPLGLTDCGTEDDAESLASPQPGQALESQVSFDDEGGIEPWNTFLLSEFKDPLPSPDHHGPYDGLHGTDHPVDLSPYIDLDTQPDYMSQHGPQRSNLPGLSMEPHSTPVTSFPGPANFMFDGVPVQDS